MTLDEAIKHCEEVAEQMGDFCGSNKFAVEYLQIAEYLEQVPRWVSVKDELPKTIEDVIVVDENDFVFSAYYLNESWYFAFTAENIPNRVTHWMSLPQPPKE